MKMCRSRRALMTVLLLIMFGLTYQTLFLRTDNLDVNKKGFLSFLMEIGMVDEPESSILTKEPPAGRQLGGENSKRNDSIKTCEPKSHIVFLKTHKTGSSTIQNILYRYGDSRNLTFALPSGGVHRFCYPAFFQPQCVKPLRGGNKKTFDIICNHMRFRKSEVAKMMPEDSFYFSILRHPVPMMESMFSYFGRLSAVYGSHNLDGYLDKVMNDKKSAVNIHFTHNNLAFDLGRDNEVTAETKDLEEVAAKVIAGIERDFHLILINDYFDESMILLKHALCWSLQDLLSFKVNSRSDKSRIPVSPETAEKIKRWNALDWRIYLHFNATFWEKVESVVGREQMKREVSELRELQAQLTSTCLKEGQPVDPKKVEDAGLKPFQGAAVVLGYNLNTDLDEHTATKCRQLITPELQFMGQLYNQQFPKRDGEP